MITSGHTGSKKQSCINQRKLCRVINFCTTFSVSETLPPLITKCQTLFRSMTSSKPMIGLIEASRHFDAQWGASFETYAGIGVRGVCLMKCRGDWVPKVSTEMGARLPGNDPISRS